MAKGRTTVVVRQPKKKRKSYKRGFTLPIGVVAGFAPIAVKAWEAVPGGASNVARELGRITTGFDFWDGTWDWYRMRYGVIPLAVGVFAHKIIGGKLGLNRALAKSGIPILRF